MGSTPTTLLKGRVFRKETLSFYFDKEGGFVLNNAETIVKVKSSIIDLINNSGLSLIELQYILNPIVNEVNAMIQKEEQSVMQQLNSQQANEEVEDIEDIEDAEVIGDAESDDGK